MRADQSVVSPVVRRSKKKAPKTPANAKDHGLSAHTQLDGGLDHNPGQIRSIPLGGIAIDELAFLVLH